MAMDQRGRWLGRWEMPCAMLEIIQDKWERRQTNHGESWRKPKLCRSRTWENTRTEGGVCVLLSETRPQLGIETSCAWNYRIPVKRNEESWSLSFESSAFGIAWEDVSVWFKDINQHTQGRMIVMFEIWMQESIATWRLVIDYNYNLFCSRVYLHAHVAQTAWLNDKRINYFHNICDKIFYVFGIRNKIQRYWSHS